MPEKRKNSFNEKINSINSKFSDGQYLYTSKRGQVFDVIIKDKKAINIQAHDGDLR